MNELHRNILHLNVNLKINHMGKKITLRASNLHSANPASQNWPGAQISTPVLIFTPAVSWCFHHWIGLHPVHQCIIVFPCRRRRLLCSGEEDRPGGDHGAGASEGQRVLVKRGGSRWSGQPQRSRHALRGGGSQSAAVHQRQLRHFHTREHTWRTAVSTVRLTFTHTHIIRDTGKNIIFFFFCNFQHRVTVFGLFSRNCRDVVSFSYTGGFYSNVPYSLLWLSPNTLCQILHCWLSSILKCNCLRRRNTMQGGTILKMSVRLTSVNHLTLGWMRAWVRADSPTRRPFYTCVPLY